VHPPGLLHRQAAAPCQLLVRRAGVSRYARVELEAAPADGDEAGLRQLGKGTVELVLADVAP